MIIYSELTGKQYNSVDECLAAEDSLKKQIEKEEELKRAKEEELEEAYEEAIEACERYMELAGIDYKDLDDGFKIKINRKITEEDLDKIWEGFFK